MSRFRKNGRRSVPSLNTTALPDLIFTLLFFFMIVTNMRSVPVLTQYRLPSASELQELKNKSMLIQIMAGETDGKPTIQFNSTLCTLETLPLLLEEAKAGLDADERAGMTVVLKIDRKTPMGTVNDIRAALRRAGLLTVYYSAEKKSPL